MAGSLTDQTNREDHRRDCTDETRGIGLEPWRGVGRESQSATERYQSSSHKGVDKHLVNSHTGFLRTNPGDKLRSLSRRESIHSDRKCRIIVENRKNFNGNDL